MVLSTLLFSTGLYLEIEGRAKVAWNKNDNTYRAQRSYLNLTIPLIHDGSFLQGNVTRILFFLIITVAQFLLPIEMADAGLKFPFSFALPHEIPCSYEGKSGNIRYSIKAVIKRHSLFKMVYVTQQVYFIVKAVVDLSKDVSTLVKVEIYFLLGIVSHFKTFLNRRFHCVNRFQNHSRSGLWPMLGWIERMVIRSRWNDPVQSQHRQFQW